MFSKNVDSKNSNYGKSKQKKITKVRYPKKILQQNLFAVDTRELTHASKFFIRATFCTIRPMKKRSL